MKVHIVIDPATCVGIGKCEELAEDAVELGDDGVSHPIAPVEEELARTLCEACPTGAISIGEPAE